VAGDVILMVNEHHVGTHGECVALIDRSSKGLVKLGLRGSRSTDYDGEYVAPVAPERSTEPIAASG